MVITLRYSMGINPNQALSRCTHWGKKSIFPLLNEHRKRRKREEKPQKYFHLPFNLEHREALGMWSDFRPAEATLGISASSKGTFVTPMVRNAFINLPTISPLRDFHKTPISEHTNRPLSDKNKPKDVLQALMSIQPAGPGCKSTKSPKPDVSQRSVQAISLSKSTPNGALYLLM